MESLVVAIYIVLAAKRPVIVTMVMSRPFPSLDSISAATTALVFVFITVVAVVIALAVAVNVTAPWLARSD